MWNLWERFFKEEDKRKEISDNSTLLLFVCLGVFNSAISYKDSLAQTLFK